MAELTQTSLSDSSQFSTEDLTRALGQAEYGATKEKEAKGQRQKAAEAQIMSAEGGYSKPAPEFKPTEESAAGFAALGSLLAVAGAMLGSKGKTSGLMAMNAVTGMMNGYNSGRKDLYEQQRLQFEENMKTWEKNRTLIKEAFDRALKIAPVNLSLARDTLNKDLVALGAQPLAAMNKASGPMAAASSFVKFDQNMQSQLDKIRKQTGSQGYSELEAQIKTELAARKAGEEERFKKAQTAKEEKLATDSGKWKTANIDGKNVYIDPETKLPVRDPNGNVIEVGSTASRRYGVPLDDPKIEELAQKVANLSLDPRTLTAVNKDKVIARASEINPNYNQGDYGNTNLAYRQWTSPNGAGTKQLASFSVAAQHLDALEQYGKALQNGDMPLANAMLNRLSVALGHEEVTDFNTARQAVAAEIVRAITASAGAKSDRQEAENAFNSNASPAQIQGAINVSRRLIGSRLDTARSQFKIGTKREDKDFDALLPPEVENNFGSFSTSGETGTSKSSVPSDVTTSGW
jgi:hypothetical protein